MRWLVLFLTGCAASGPIDTSVPATSQVTIVDSGKTLADSSQSVPPVSWVAPKQAEAGASPASATVEDDASDEYSETICRTNVGGTVSDVQCSTGFSWAPIGSSNMTDCAAVACPVGAWCETDNGVSGFCQ